MRRCRRCLGSGRAGRWGGPPSSPGRGDMRGGVTPGSTPPSAPPSPDLLLCSDGVQGSSTSSLGRWGTVGRAMGGWNQGGGASRDPVFSTSSLSLLVWLGLHSSGWLWLLLLLLMLLLLCWCESGWWAGRHSGCQDCLVYRITLIKTVNWDLTRRFVGFYFQLN